MSKLTDKQEMFCREYLIDLNATQAAIRAGYSAKTANAAAGRLLSNVSIQARISELKQERIEEVKIDANWVLLNAKRVFDKCMQDEPVLDRNGDPIMVRTEQGELAAAYRFDSTGANKALDTIGKHVEVQAFSTKIDHTSSDGTMSPTAESRDKRKARIQELLNGRSGNS
ncbi:terminase small subunit [Vibrio fluvialis]|nr:terminase small subunit [Vibrio fluvialis]EKO3527568.1 terminase small subunit [Vibrio fluvialis]